MKTKLLIIILLWPLTVTGQTIITLKDCYDLAIASNALAGEKKAYSDISAIKDQNISKGWLPTIDANGSILYNSSVADVSNILGSLPIPGIASAIKPLPNEQYKITIEVNQILYDGGAIEGARMMERADLKVNEKQTEADIYKLRSQINSYYFNLLLIDRQKELLTNYLEVINKRINSIQSAVNNGVVLKSDIDIMLSEKIKLQQQLSENDIRKEALLRILSAITGKKIDSTFQLTLPVSVQQQGGILERPELEIFDLRKDQLEAGIKLLDIKRKPKAFGFATLGYGNPPGSNFFRDEFAPYYILGAGVKWNILDWNKTKNEKAVISLQQGIIDNRKKELSDNLQRMLDLKTAEIISLKTLLESDKELIALRKKITATSESQYNNGTITATDYLNELNSERQALVNCEIHKINLAMAGIDYLNISGKEIQ